MKVLGMLVAVETAAIVAFALASFGQSAVTIAFVLIILALASLLIGLLVWFARFEVFR